MIEYLKEGEAEGVEREAPEEAGRELAAAAAEEVSGVNPNWLKEEVVLRLAISNSRTREKGLIFQPAIRSFIIENKNRGLEGGRLESLLKESGGGREGERGREKKKVACGCTGGDL